MDSNIQTLVFKAKQGDNSAFSTLYQIYYPKMKGICINILKEDKDVMTLSKMHLYLHLFL